MLLYFFFKNRARIFTITKGLRLGLNPDTNKLFARAGLSFFGSPLKKFLVSFRTKQKTKFADW